MMQPQHASKILQIIRNEIAKQLGGGTQKRVPKPAVMGMIDPAYASGLPNVVLDDDPSKTPVGPYPYLSTYTPKANDRVLLLQVGNSGKYVIQGKVIYQ
ncbi:hypothetical protein [Alicyclobacillus fodiniaquatilis]|uniref:Uncharacterized protein n=1 Tax=Alicyclobacillus fodiniaquatilis TaxID=1661150 RepID=A0ABW4JHY3_9BACL